MNWNSPLAVAFRRALWSALAAAVVAYLGSLSQGHTNMEALITAAYMAATTLGLRGGAEGMYDQAKAP